MPDTIMLIGIFVSDTLYYVASSGLWFYHGQNYYSNYEYLSSKYQTVIYSSD